MKIVIAAVAASQHLSGVSRHGANLARCLLTRPEVDKVHLIIGHWQRESMRDALPSGDGRLSLREVSIRSRSLERNLWYLNDLPSMAASLGADIVHLAYPVPLRRGAFQCPTVVTLHDLYPYDIPANFGFPKALFNRAVLRQCLRSADAIACVSDSTWQRLAMRSPSLALRKAVTIHNCVEAGPAMAARSQLPAWRGEPFLLCVAQHRRNKNIPLAIRVFQRLLLEGKIGPATLLVVVGIDGPETDRIQRCIRDKKLEQQVVLLRGIDDAGLQWCYGHCELLLAPSSVEGFGIPVVEAMLHRCRIVCSDIPAFREIGGSYCHYAALDPLPEEAFVLAASAAINNPSFRPAPTNRFSSQRISEAYLKLYAWLRSARLAAGSREAKEPIALFERGGEHDSVA